MSFVSFMLTSDSRINHRDAIEASKRNGVAHKLEKQEKITEIVADSDSSKSTSPKQKSSIVSAVLATACTAAVAFEAASESRHTEHTEVKLDDDTKVARVGTEPAKIIGDDQTLMIKDVAVNRAVQQTVVVDWPMSQGTTTTPIHAEMALGEAQTEIHRSRYVK